VQNGMSALPPKADMCAPARPLAPEAEFISDCSVIDRSVRRRAAVARVKDIRRFGLRSYSRGAQLTETWFLARSEDGWLLMY
jgi:hypothetical protein